MGKRRKVTKSGWSPWVSQRPTLAFCIASVIWLTVLYHGVLRAPFVYDDLDQVANNAALSSWHAVWTQFLLKPVRFTSGFLGNGGSTYRPGFWLALAFERHVFGGGPAGFHFASLLLHWTNGVLLFLLLRRLRMRWQIAGFATLLWLGMPVTTEAVAWISAQAYPLSVIFLLVALLLALEYLRSSGWGLLLCFAGAALMANLCHEQGFLLIGFLTLGFALLEEERRLRRWAALAALAIAADTIYVACRWRVGVYSGNGQHSVWAIGAVFWRYVQIILLPVRMSVERSTDVPGVASRLIALGAWAALIGLIAAAVLLRRRVPVLAAGLGLLLIATLPYCGFVFIYQGMAERFVYLAAIGCAVIAADAVALLQSIERRAAIVGLAIWVAWSGWRLMLRVDDWQDPVALYTHSLEATPRSAYLEENLGVELLAREDHKAALQAFEQAARLRPEYAGAPALDNVKAILNYATAFAESGRRAEAESQYKRVISMAPKDSAAYVDLESLYIQEGRLDDAIAMYKRAIAVNPNDASAYFDLGVMFQLRGQPQEAAAFYKKVLQIKPGDPDALQYLRQLQGQP